MSAINRTIITRLQIRNYRSIGNTDIALGPLTVLVGPNGTGKSNIADALRFVRNALSRGIKEAVRERGGKYNIAHRQFTKDADICIHIHFRGPAWSGEYAFSLETQDISTHIIKWERISVTTPGTSEETGPCTTSFEIKDGKFFSEKNGKQHFPGDIDISKGLLTLPGLRTIIPDFNHIYQFFSDMGFYNIDPHKLRAPQAYAEPYPLDENGQNLGAVLKHLREKKIPGTSNLLEALKAVVQDLDDYSVKSAGGYLVTCLHYKPFNKKELPKPSFELALESDGTLRILGILTALYQTHPHPIPLMVIEEPELNIHPGASGVLGDVLQEASLRSQIIITTHSPDLVSTLPADTLRVVEKENGVTKTGPVMKNQRESVYEKLFSSGELMRIEGLHREKTE